MKVFTIASSILIVLLLVAALVYVGASPDFVAPGSSGPGADDRSDPVWSMTMDDILEYFVEKGLLTSVDDTWLMSSGVGTEAKGFLGAEIYWWDVDNLTEGSNEAAAWEDMNAEGMIDLWQMGTMFMPVTQNGPFGMFLSGAGDDKALLEAFQAFGRPKADDRTDPVWSLTVDDLLIYLEDKGFIDRSTMQLLANDGFCSDGCIVSGLEIAWWDVENLKEGSAEYTAFEDLCDGDGIVMLYGRYPYALTDNGPFGLYVGPDFTGDVNEVIAAFKAFGRSSSDGGSSDPVWSATLDELATYLEEQGLVSTDGVMPLAAGLCTNGIVFQGQGLEIFWWDVEHLTEGSDEKANFESMNSDGIITMWGSVMAVQSNGPFGLYYWDYSGDVNALVKAFQSFGR